MAEKRLFLNWSLRKNLRAKVTLGVVIPLVLILGIFTFIDYSRHQNVTLNNLSLLAAQSGKVIENNLRHAMAESDFSEVQILLDSLGESEEFRIVYLLDMDGKVIFAPKGEGVGSQLDNMGQDCLPCHDLPASERPESVVVTVEDGQRVFRSMQPIENRAECAQCHNPEEPLIGLVLTDIPMDPIESAFISDLRENLLWWASTILATVIIVNLTLNRMVLSHLQRMALALSNFSQGRLNIQIPAGDPDEIGILSIAFNDMVQRIEAETAENLALSEHLKRQSSLRGELLKRLINAQENERKRIARELHDELGQALSGLAFQAEITERFIASDPDRAVEQLHETRALIDETTNQMYDLILDLRPAALDDLGLVAALRAHFDRVLSETGIDYELHADQLNDRLAPEIETCLYRTFQEALTNIIRHADANYVRVSLAKHNSTFEGEIVDDGCGFDPQFLQRKTNEAGGLGIIGMQERVTQCGGHLKVNSRKGSGTQIHIHIPLEETTGD